MKHIMTFDIFCFKLSQQYPLIPCNEYTAGRRLKNIRLFGDARPDRHYLYLLSWEEYTNSLKTYADCPVLLFNMPENQMLPKGNMVILSGRCELKELVNAASVIFAEFEDWHEKLHYTEEKKVSPEVMLERLAGYMQMEIALAAGQKKSFDYATIKKNDCDPMGIYAVPPDEMMAFLNTQKEFSESFYSHSVEAYPELYNGLVYYYNFFLEDEYLARLLGIFPDNAFASGQLRLFRYISVYAEKLYIRHYKDKYRQQKSKQFLSAIRTLLEAGEIQSQVLHNLLEPYSWREDHIYQVIKFNQDNLGKNRYAMEFFCSSIDEQFPSCCALQIDMHIFCVRNVSLENKPQEFNQNLSVFLRDNLCNAGLSNEQKNILRLPMLAKEAEDALCYGPRNHPMLWSFHFSDYILDYLKDTMTEKYTPEELEHNAVRILREHDRIHRSCLTETLRIFTEQKFSASAAANAMYIHRSTFLHRLSRIQELTHINFDNKKDRIWLALSFFINPPG